MSSSQQPAGNPDDYNPIVLCQTLRFTEEHYEMIKDNKDIMNLIRTGCKNTLEKMRRENASVKDLHEFSCNFFMEVVRLCNTGGRTLAKHQLFGCLMDVMNEDAKLYKKGERELAEAKIASYESSLTKVDPWVNFENKKYRYSRFMMMKRKACYIVKMPETGEYLAMDVEKLQNGFDKMKIPLKVKDLPSIDENDERIPPHSRGKEPTELEGLVFKTMCELIIANGEKKDEKKEEKVVELDPVAQAKLDKKKEANRKTKERKKAAKKAKKDLKAMDEKEDFKLEVVDEEAPPPATSPV